MPPLTFRSMPEAVAAMLRAYWARTGIQPDATEGSILRTLFEAWGYEGEQHSARFDAALRDAIPEAVFAAFGFDREPAVRAFVTLRFSRASPAPQSFLIPEGTNAETATGIRFATSADASLAAASTQVDVPALAIVPGAAGNVAANSITRLSTLLPGVEAVTNPQTAYGGRDAESLAAQQARFALYLASLAKGTAPAIAAAALTVETAASERAQQALVVDNYDDIAIPIGEARVYVYRPGGASIDLLNAILAHLELTQRPVGIAVSVLDVPPITVNVNIVVVSNTTASIARAYDAAQAFFDAIRIGEDVYNDAIERAISRNDADLYRASVNIGTVLPVPIDGDWVIIGPYERAELGAIEVFHDTTTVT